jgi:hypothetical protein
VLLVKNTVFVFFDNIFKSGDYAWGVYDNFFERHTYLTLNDNFLPLEKSGVICETYFDVELTEISW